ncbi:hypothetical protein MACK_002318 [Theileria orientalis]|uniref:Condensin complex subunit 2 n=1 Tax=Theileria orientalis TaxID=68886 RepID=A0A976MC03_THEOR|nr:hypothetical protein MACK_002318 [Theileria orientalis]
MKDGIRLTSKRKTILELNENSPTRKRSKTVSDGINEENEQKNRLTKTQGVTNVGNNKGMGVSSPNAIGNMADSSKREDEKVDKTKLLSLFTDCMTALSSNKICSWNAFDIGIIDHIDDLVTLKNEQAEEEDIGDVCFSTASKVVEGASKVYGYRVEAVYDKTFNVLMNIQTTEKEQKKQRTGKKKIYEFTGGNTLSPENEVTLTELPVEAILMDPFFLKISSLFDQSGPQGLLLVNLLVNNNLQLSLSSTASTIDSDELRDKSSSSSQGLTASDFTLSTSGCNSSSRDATNITRGIDGGDNEKDNNNNNIYYNNNRNTKLNRGLLSQIVGSYSDLEILPELSKYMRHLSPEMLPGYLQEELTDLPAELIPNLTQEKLAISDQASYGLQDEPVVDIQLEERESIQPYSQEIESTQDSIDMLQQTQESTGYGEHHDSYMDEGGFDGTQEEFYDANEVGEDLNLLDRINIIDINNQLSFYSTSNIMTSPRKEGTTGEGIVVGSNITGVKSLTIGSVGGGAGLVVSGVNGSEKGLKSRATKVKAEKVTIEKYIYTSNLNEELDSIELLSHYVEATKTRNSGFNIKAGLNSLLNARKYTSKIGGSNTRGGNKGGSTGRNWFEGNFVNLSHKVSLNQLLNNYNIYLNLSSAQGEASRSSSALNGNSAMLESSMDKLSNQLNHLNSIRHSVLGSNRTSINGDLGDMDPVGDGFEYEMSQQMEEQNNFIDVLKLKTYIMEYLSTATAVEKSEDGVGRSGSKDSTESTSRKDSGNGPDVRFNGLVDYIYRKVNKNVISIHILFVCLLHVCNESNLRLEPIEQGKDARTPRVGKGNGDALVIVPNTQEFSTSSTNNDFRIKFDSFNP